MVLIEGDDGMVSISRILVPVDGSISSAKAVEKAIFLAKKCGAALDFLYVASDINKDIPSAIIFDEIWKKLPVGVSAEKHIESEHVPQAIIAAARNLKSDMIIMGSRGLGIFRGALIGSVSQKVIEDALVPVLVVK